MHQANGRRVTAVIPAAGRATRLGSTISGSKEVVDIGGRPAISYLLERLSAAGIDRAIITLRPAKWDIPAAILGEARHGLAPAYVMIEDSPSPAHSIAPALRFAAEDVVALAFPDVIFEPVDALATMRERLTSSGADVVLGVFPSATPERVDMVRLDGTQRVVEIVIKQPDRGLRYCWTLALWTPRFSAYLLDRLGTDGHVISAGGEFQIGDIIQAAIHDGMTTESVVFAEGRYLDVGTPADLETARRQMRSAESGP
jgi:glucose-1-phosphate thymidylyltransferase